MAEPVFFVVEQFNGRLCPALYYERLPTRYTDRRAHENGLRYQLRIDDKPHLAGRMIFDLFEEWSDRKGSLPAELKMAEVIENARLEGPAAPPLDGRSIRKDRALPW